MTGRGECQVDFGSSVEHFEYRRWPHELRAKPFHFSPFPASAESMAMISACSAGLAGQSSQSPAAWLASSTWPAVCHASARSKTARIRPHPLALGAGGALPLRVQIEQREQVVLGRSAVVVGAECVALFLTLPELCGEGVGARPVLDDSGHVLIALSFAGQQRALEPDDLGLERADLCDHRGAL